MEEQKIIMIWVGPNGDNPEIGSVTRGEEREMTVEQAEYFKSLKLVKDISTKKDTIIKKEKLNRRT